MKKLKIFVFVAILMLAMLTVLSSCAKKEDIVSSDITSVEIKGKGDKREVKIEAEFTEEDLAQHEGKTVYLIAKDTSGKNTTYTALDDVKIKSNIKFEVPFKTNGKTHINTAFVCAIAEGEGEYMQFTPITNEKYITNVSDMGSNVSRPEISSIKGIATSNIGHADYLGARHIMLEVRIDKILLEKYEEGAKSITSQGLTYYFDGKYVENLDNEIKQATKNGSRVYLQFILKRPLREEYGKGETVKDTINCLYYSGAISQDPDAFLPDMTNKQAIGYLTALFDFTAERYSGGEYGTAIDYIIGKNANSTNWNNAGKTDSEDALKHYVSYVRLAYNSLTSRVSNGMVYASFNNTWTGARSSGSYGYIISFATQAKATGDFGWNIAMSYGDIDNDTAWGNSTGYGETFTADNLTELSGLLDSIKYKKDKRGVIINNFSLKENIESETSAKKRSASYAYMYYKTANSKIVDALIYSVYDSQSRGLINGTTGTETSLCDTFKICGSNRISELDQYSSVLGDKWYDIKDGDAIKSISVYYAPQVSSINTSSPKKFFDFTSGSIYGFEAVGSADYAGLSEYINEDGTTTTYLKSGGKVSLVEDEWRVVFCDMLDKTDIDSSKYLGITMSSQYSGEKITVIISGTAKKTDEKISLVATAAVDSTPKEYFFDIAAFADKLSSDEVSISICSPQMRGLEAGELSVYRASLYGASGSRILIYIIIGIIVVLVAVALVLIVRMLEKRRKKKAKKAKRKESSNKKVKDPPKKTEKDKKRSKNNDEDDIIVEEDDEEDDDGDDDEDEDIKFELCDDEDEE